MKPKIEFDGLEAFTKGMNWWKVSASKAKTVVKKNGAKLSQETQKNMREEYTGHYEGNKFVRPTGATRRSTGVEISEDGMKAIVAPSTKYFPYLEYGTRFMDERPTLRPAFKMVSQMFVKDMQDLFK